MAAWRKSEAQSSAGTARWATDPSAKRDAQTNECLLISNANPAMRPARWRRSPSLVRRHLYSFDGLFDERRHRIWPRHVDGVTARDLCGSLSSALLAVEPGQVEGR